MTYTLEDVKQLHKDGVCLSRNRDEIIRAACQEGNLEVVRYLFEQTTEHFSIDDYDHLLLKQAASSSNIDLVRYLYHETSHSASLTFEQNYLLRWAFASENNEMIQFLFDEAQDQILDELEPFDAIRSAFVMSSDTSIRYFAENCNWLLTDDNLKLGLFAAARHSAMDVIRFFYEEYDAPIPQEVQNGLLVVAAEHGSQRLVEYILQDASFELNDYGQKAVLLASQNGFFPIVRHLLDEEPAFSTSESNIQWYIGDKTTSAMIEYLLEDSTQRIHLSMNQFTRIESRLSKEKRASYKKLAQAEKFVDECIKQYPEMDIAFFHSVCRQFLQELSLPKMLALDVHQEFTQEQLENTVGMRISGESLLRNTEKTQRL